ncbi:hypothetical protein BGZ80_002781 [Entomortierella chlamydospora]|uniref:HotDog ACOT-type domain-containing protein n=1 Tax=Entomortierella chlamydospora TaxID=101097 RepID=A0A9P6N120_9FUNG|nr:hypothetical protein BGZ79_003699 [Entomortierella chlamydospora]KAG0021251.1 hypothetical protein BGZ80_002781 [Entomortierella chlamydospora]
MFTPRTHSTLSGLAIRSGKRRAFTTLRPLFNSEHRAASEVASSSATATAAQSSSSAKESLLIEKTGTEILEKLGSKSAGRVVATSALPHGKVFTVRPIKSWIDKIASDHGSPGGHFAAAGAQGDKKYQKRDLVLKTMQDSYTEIILPFKTDKALLEEYINVGGTLRYGKIMEDLDALAGAISYKHADDGKIGSSPLTIVTASVDRIDLLKPLVVSDIRLSGHVSYVGFSSMEIFMKMEEICAEKPEQHGDTILVARFTMVARDALTNKAAQVNPMFLRNDAEKKLFQMGESQKARKRLATDASLTKRPPTEDERFLIHDLYLEYSEYDNPESKTKKPDDVEWMADTKMSALHIMQPQDRNIHDKIFGGYLMRLAYELAFSNASVFISSRPTFLALDEISFRKPVSVGTFLVLDSQVVYSEGGDSQSFQVMVKADVLDVKRKTRDTTNTFWFTFTNPVKGTPRIMPRTYAESMLYIEGQRRRRVGAQMAGMSRKTHGPQE